MDFGSFMSGLAGGLKQAEENKHKRELLKLEKQKLDMADKERSLKVDELKRKITQADQLNTLGNEFAGAESYQSKADYLTPTTGQENPPTQDVSGFDPSARPTRTSKDVLRELIVRSGHPEKLLDKPGTAPGDIAAQLQQYHQILNPGGSNVDAQGKPLFQSGIGVGGKPYVKPVAPEQAPKGDVSDLWARYRDRRFKEGEQDIVAIRGEFNKLLGDTAFERSKRQAEGGLEIRSSPLALETKQKESTATSQGKPLESTDRTAITAMQDTLRIANQMKQGFDQNDLNKYVGFMKFPANRIAQLAKNDPKFAQFQTLANEMKGTAFGEGGKNLTELEARITFGHRPIGNEFSTSDFVAKLDQILAQTPGQIERRLSAASTPKAKLTTQGLVEAANPKKLRFNPNTGKIE